MLKFIIAALLLVGTIHCAKWKAADIPNPTIDFERCGNNGVSRWICDPDNFLTQYEKEQVQEKLDLIFENVNATCVGQEYGYQIGVLFVESIESTAFFFSSSAEEFAINVFDQWGLGYAECQTGILIVISIKDRYLYIRTGEEAKKLLTNSKIDDVRKHYMNPQLKHTRYYRAVEEGLTQITLILQNDAFQYFNFGFTKRSTYITMGICGAVLFLGLIAIAKGSIQSSRCKRKLTQLEQNISDSKAQNYKQTSCPICLEDLPSSVIYIGSDEYNAEGKNATTTQLLCGHKFCTPCLKKTIKNECPICRDPINKDDPLLQKAPSCSQAMSQDEYVFRLHSIHRHYPNYFTSRHLNEFSQGTYHTHSSMVTRCFPIKTTSSHKSSGRSFGGGSSRSGGGSGGHW